MNGRRLWACALALLLGLGAAPQARAAIMLSLDPAAQTVGVGDPVTVDLNISGLGDFAAPSLGVWDVDIGFDSTILGFTGASFGNQLDLFGLGSITGAFDLGGVVDLFEVSLDSPADLNALQAGAFTLASLTFDALAAGTSPLSLTIDSLGDADAVPLAASATGGSVTVAAVAVPEPASWPLFVVGLAALTGLGRRRTGARTAR